MNLYRLAVIVLRVWGIDWLYGALIHLTGLPGEFMALLDSRAGYFQTRAEISFAMSLTYNLAEAGAGGGLLVWSHSWARFLTKSFLADGVHTEVPQDVWPPPPRFFPPIERTAQLALEPIRSDSILRAAGIVIRVDGITWLLSCFLSLLSLPVEIFGSLSYHGGYWKAQYLLSVSMTVMSFLARLSVGLYLLFSPQSLATRISRDLVQDAESDIHEVTAIPQSEGVSDSETMPSR